MYSEGILWLSRLRYNFKNPYRIAAIFISPNMMVLASPPNLIPSEDIIVVMMEDELTLDRIDTQSEFNLVDIYVVMIKKIAIHHTQPYQTPVIIMSLLKFRA